VAKVKQHGWCSDVSVEIVMVVGWFVKCDVALAVTAVMCKNSEADSFQCKCVSSCSIARTQGILG
jgi:hypothetical protein